MSYFLVSYSGRFNEFNPFMQLLFSLMVYALFLLSSKMTGWAWASVLGVMGAIFVLSMVSETLAPENEQGRNGIRYTQIVLLVVAFILMVVGVGYHMRDQQKAFGSAFSYVDFFFGLQECDLSAPKTQFTAPLAPAPRAPPAVRANKVTFSATSE